MKAIEQAAQEYAEKVTLNAGADRTKRENAFRAGVKFAQQWIDVNDELPDEKIQVLTKMNFEYEREMNKTVWINSIRGGSWILNNGIVTHWRPIELK